MKSVSLNSSSVDDLVQRARKGEGEAMGELFARYKDRLYATVLRIMGHQQDAEEVLQDTFLTAFTQIHRFKGKSAFYTWLYRIAVNGCYAMYKKRRPTDAVTDDVMGHVLDGRRADYQMTVRVLLDWALSQMPVGYRTILILYDVEGFEHHEIAKILSIRPGTSKSQLFKARKRMNELIKPHIHLLRQEIE